MEILFLADSVEEKWGRFDPQSNQVHLHPEAGTDDEDILDFTAIQTIINGGSVYLLDRSQLPDGEALAALFRY